MFHEVHKQERQRNMFFLVSVALVRKMFVAYFSNTIVQEFARSQKTYSQEETKVAAKARCKKKNWIPALHREKVYSAHISQTQTFIIPVPAFEFFLVKNFVNYD